MGTFLSEIRAADRHQREPADTDVWPREYASPCPSERTTGTENVGANNDSHASSDTTRMEPEDLRTRMEREEALLVVAMYGTDTLVRAVGRGLVARRLMDALLPWRTEQILNAIGDAQKD